mmetsp:Transcript_19408/g.48344  ORF Transcript_19408/g.48344 Transcript_19408/m.48344 type:complete len:143 (-) Transcript_19408:2434-2862(-)
MLDITIPLWREHSIDRYRHDGREKKTNDGADFHFDNRIVFRPVSFKEIDFRNYDHFHCSALPTRRETSAVHDITTCSRCGFISETNKTKPRSRRSEKENVLGCWMEATPATESSGLNIYASWPSFPSIEDVGVEMWDSRRHR